MGNCLGSSGGSRGGGVNMDKPVGKKQLEKAKKMQKAQGNKSVQGQKLRQAEMTGVLSMSASRLTQIPPSALSIAKLTLIDLSDNAIVQLPTALASLSKVKKLDLSKNKIEVVPDLSRMNALTLLQLNSNRIHQVGNLPSKLKAISLQANLLSAVPKNLLGLSNLETLNISKNKLSGELPGWLAKIVRLKGLEADDNKFTTISPSLGESRSLESLNIRRNQLSQIPSKLLKSPALAAMRLEGNRISKTGLMETDGWEEFNVKRKALLNKQVSAGIGDFDRSVCGLD